MDEQQTGGLLMPGHTIDMRGQPIELAGGALVKCQDCKAIFHPLADMKLCKPREGSRHE